MKLNYVIFFVELQNNLMDICLKNLILLKK